MEALSNALAVLVALESRFHDLVDPVGQVADAVKSVVKEAAILVESLHGRVAKLEDLELRVAALEAHAEAVSHAPAIESDVPAFQASSGAIVRVIEASGEADDLSHLEGADVNALESGAPAAEGSTA